ncbi:hypothetical protein Tco_1237099, partial [Tanacetum coccineum]
QLGEGGLPFCHLSLCEVGVSFNEFLAGGEQWVKFRSVAQMAPQSILLNCKDGPLWWIQLWGMAEMPPQSYMRLESVEEKLEVYKANESIYLQDIKGLKFEIHIGEITIRELKKKLDIVQKEKYGIQLNVDKFENASKSLNKLIECQIVDTCNKGLGYENYNAVLPPYIGNFMPPTPNLSFTGLDEFVNKSVVKNSKAMSSKEEPKVVRKYDDAPSIEEWVSDDEEEDHKEFDLLKWDHNDEQEVGEIFRIETNLFNYETPLCEKFKEFNYLLKIDLDLLTKDIEGFKTYDEYKDDWIYEWNKNVPWVHEKPWTDTGVWTEPAPVVHYCKPFNYKSRYSKWPTCSWKEDGYCNGRNLPGAYIVGNTLYYQYLEWYDVLKDRELKDEALRNKAIMEGLINEDDESSNNGWRRWDGYEIADHDHEESEYENGHEDKEGYELFNDHELPVCNIRRFEMIKYSFEDEEEYVAIKEDEYDDLTSTSKDACRAYQEIFRMMDEGWMVTRNE